VFKDIIVLIILIGLTGRNGAMKYWSQALMVLLVKNADIHDERNTSASMVKE